MDVLTIVNKLVLSIFWDYRIDIITAVVFHIWKYFYSLNDLFKCSVKYLSQNKFYWQPADSISHSVSKYLSIKVSIYLTKKIFGKIDKIP